MHLCQGHSPQKSFKNFVNIKDPDQNTKSLHQIKMKLFDIVSYQASENPVDFWENSLKIKVTVTKNLSKFCKD